MGDLVLTQDEVNPVMEQLLENGIEVTALHNHLLRSEPGTMYMHVSGHGDSVKLAAALHDGARAEQDADGEPAAPPRAQAAPELDTAAIDAAIGQGKANGPVYQCSIPRAEAIRRRHGGAGPDGVGHRDQFQGTDGGKAAITGDFVLPAEEVNPVLRALHAARHRGDGDPQPHARRRAAPVLHAFLGERRSAEAGTGLRAGARPREDQKGLAKGVRRSGSTPPPGRPTNGLADRLYAESIRGSTCRQDDRRT